ncbi:MAG: DNA mismatch repair endonuclease MutL [Lentisphaeria bacterium]|nr:DNA mismatch repair endonuclease MutL [Lentisphaeria bacterium]
MGIIKVLPAEIAGRIAAGEVIERPASVIKELVENSIDAGATRIRVLTEQGGHKLMQVIDDGKGMDRQDAMLCLEAHATSKITKEGDVGQIRTLGFRGEALPSISAVSRFELQTRQAEQVSGTEVVVNNGVIQDVRECGCAPGTSIKVQWLFGNLPARRKFLRGPATEDDYIQEMLLMLSLTRPDISFELHQNGRCVLRAPSSLDIAGRVEMLIGKDAFAAMMPVEYSEDGIHVYGFISKPGFTRSNRRDQRIIVNGRAASAETVFYAIREAYDTLVVKGRYPGVVLYVDIAPERVDVNVHPTKREVRFREPARVSNVVGAALRQSLRGMSIPQQEIFQKPLVSSAEVSGVELVDTTPVVSGSAAADAAPNNGEAPHVENREKAEERREDEKNAATPSAPVFPERPVTPVMPRAFQPIQAPLPFAPEDRDADSSSSSDVNAPPKLGAALPASTVVDASKPTGNYRLLGPLGKDYLLAETSTGLIVVNVFAASQRVLFERLLANLKTKDLPRQALLIPVTIHLAPDEARLMARELPFFHSIGYSLDEFGANAFLVTAVPQNIPDKDIGTTIRDILGDLRQDSVTNRQSAVHLAQLASRHAVRRKEHLEPAEQMQLLDELMRCEMPYADPAGLPTMVHITYSELSKRFRT